MAMGIKSLLVRSALHAVVVIFYFSSSSKAQIRDLNLYLDDGSGNFSILSGATAGGAFSLPFGGGTLLTTFNSSTITVLGTITSGVWNGTPIMTSFGGTGISSYTPYSIITGGTTAAGNLQQVSGLGSANQILTSNGPNALPTWQDAGAGSGTVTSISGSGGTTGLTLTGGAITTSGTLTLGGTLVVANGGTGVTSTSANTIFAGPASGLASAPAFRALVSADIPNNAANTSGNATTATSALTAGTFSGSLVGDVTGTQPATVVSAVGGSTAANVHSAELAANAATNASTGSTIVKRDASGNFIAGTITANLTGNATNVTGTVLGANGGTGIVNSGKTITLGGNLVTSGAFALTLTTTAATSVTLPTSGTLMTSPMTTLGDMIYGGASGVPMQLSGNTSASTKKFLTSTAASGVATAPAWGTIVATDMPTFVGEGGSAAQGAVPSPGNSGTTTRFLREDATWVTPAGGSSTALMISAVTAGNFSNNANTPEYWYPMGEAIQNTPAGIAESNVMLIDRAGTIKNLTVTITALPTGTGTATFTIYDGATSTGVTVTFTSITALTLTDNTHTFSAAAGDLITLQTLTTHTGFQSGTDGTWVFDIQ